MPRYRSIGRLIIRHLDSILMEYALLDYVSWLFTSSPLGAFLERLRELKPDELKGTKRYKMVLAGFHALVWDVLIFSGHVGWIIRRLDVDISHCLEPDLTPKRGRRLATIPFETFSLLAVDLSSLILFGRILMDKIARLMHNIIVGEAIPSSSDFTDWRSKVDELKGEDLEELRGIIERQIGLTISSV